MNTQFAKANTQTEIVPHAEIVPDVENVPDAKHVHVAKHVPELIQKIHSLKIAIIAVTNVLASVKGQALLKESLKIIDPTVKLLTDEIIISIRNNNTRLLSVLKEFATPVATAIRDAMGAIPGFGEGLGIYLAAKNASLSFINGVNMFSSIADSFITIPLNKIFNQTFISIEHAKELKGNINNMSREVKSALQLINEIDKETEKIGSMINTGTDINSLITKQQNIISNKVTSVADKVTSVADKVTSVADKVTSVAEQAVSNKVESVTDKLITGGKLSSQSIIKNTTKRIRHSLKHFLHICIFKKPINSAFISDTRGAFGKCNSNHTLDTSEGLINRKNNTIKNNTIKNNTIKNNTIKNKKK
jgi:hypothetical protein